MIRPYRFGRSWTAFGRENLRIVFGQIWRGGLACRLGRAWRQTPTWWAQRQTGAGHLRWEYVKDGCIELPDARADGRVVPLGSEARAVLEDVRIHNLRHTYASRALALGESLMMIGSSWATPRCRRPPGLRIWRGISSKAPPHGSSGALEAIS